MRYAVVPGDKISTTSLRARDHVFSPRSEAKKIIDAWTESHLGLRHMSALKDLQPRLEAALEAAYKKGQEER